MMRLTIFFILGAFKLIVSANLTLKQIAALCIRYQELFWPMEIPLRNPFDSYISCEDPKESSPHHTTALVRSHPRPTTV